MPRFISNRWWAFVLALGLVLVSVVASRAHAGGTASGSFVTNGDMGDSGGSPPPPTVGDPDSPTNTKGRYGSGKPLGPMPVSDRSVGDGRAPGRVWTMWLGALLNITRMRCFGF